MKKLWKILVLTFIAVMTVTTLASAAPGLVDTSHKLTANDAKQIESRIQELNNKYHIAVGILLMPNLQGQADGNNFTNTYLQQNNYGQAQNGGIVLTIDLQKNKAYIVTDAKLGHGITKDAGVKRLLDNVKNNKNLAAVCKGFLGGVDELTGSYLKTGKSASGPAATATGTSTPTSSKDTAKKTSGSKGPGLLGYGVALLVALAVAFGYRSHLRSQMSNVSLATTALAYVDEEGLVLTSVQDEFDHREVTRTPRSSGRSSSSNESSDNDSSDGEGENQG